MSSSPASTHWLARTGRSVPYFLGQLAIVLGLWLALIRFPAGPATGLDPSWRMVLGYALEHGWQFGRDIIFTYGPLGFLLGNTNSGGLYVGHLVWQLGANFAFALSLWAVGRTLAGSRKITYFVFLFALGVTYSDAVHIMMILVFALSLARERILGSVTLTTLASFALGIMALVKFTNFMLAGFAAATLLVLHVWRKRWISVYTIAAGFGLGLFGGWMALGQSLHNLPAYVLNSLSLSNGYVDAMGLEASDWMMTWGLLAAATLVGYYALALYRAPNFARTLALLLICAAASFLNWKHGFVRADGHVLAHFYLCLFLACTCPIFIQDEGPFRGWKVALLSASAFFSLAGIWTNTRVTIIYSPSVVNAQIIDNTNTLGIIRDVPRNALDDFRAAQKKFLLPGIKALTAGQTVDIFGNEQAYALFNDLNYRPRPALQSYAAYNKRLQQLDLDFMASNRGPAVVLQKINSNTIDDRLPSLDDALAVRYLYHHYDYVMEEQDFLVWKRKDTDPALDEKNVLKTVPVKIGETIPAPDLGDTPVWCEIDVRPTLLGRLRTFFYKPPVLRLAVTDGGATTTTFRLVAGQAQTGFLAYPHFTSNYNVGKYQEGEHGPRIAKLALVLPPEDRKYYRASSDVRFYKLPPFPRSGKRSEKPPEVRYRVFNLIPTSVNAPFPPEITVEGGKEVLFTHPPATLEFRPTPTQHHVSGKFGVISRAYSDGNTTDGAEFIAEWVDSAGKTRQLLNRNLQPLKVAADRGEQEFEFQIPNGEGRLLLRITPGPAGNISFDWTYWTDVKFAN